MRPSSSTVLSRLSDVKLLDLPRHVQADSEIVVIEERSGLPFRVSRMFTVRGSKNAVLGRHAHKECAQVLLCVNGSVEVECDDGRAKQSFRLARGNLALFVPASLWTTVTYLMAGSFIAVLCDRPYDEADYIRDYAAFLAWRQRPLAP